MSQDLDGLSILQDRRQQLSRGAPPPRHPRSGPAEPEPGSTEQQTPAPSSASRATKPRRRSIPKATDSSPPAAAAAHLRAAQFYIDERCDDYLAEIRIEAIRRKVDISASAVVRLALHRLSEDLPPGQVADRLTAPASERIGSGRKRH